MNLVFILQIITVLVWVVVGIVVIITILYPTDDKDTDFVRTVTGLECYQLEQYIIEMKYNWDKVIEYHSFKCYLENVEYGYIEGRTDP